MVVINIFGAPGSGKSTAAAGLFHLMKLSGHNCEIVTEYAKDMVWEERGNIFTDQLYMLAKQNRKLLRLDGKVEYVITDSPIIMSEAYVNDTPYKDALTQLIKEVFLSYNNINIFINRSHEYQEIGRNQTSEEAMELATQIKTLLVKHDVEFTEFDSDKVTPDGLLSHLLTLFEK